MTPVIELLGPAVGGIKSHVTELARLLRDQGTDVVVAGPEGVLEPALRTDVVVDVPRTFSLPRVLAARRQLQRALATSGAEVVHAHGLKAGWVAVTARPQPRVVLTAHNVVLDDASPPVTMALRVLERELVRRVDHLISPSPAIDAGFARLLPPDRRSVIVPVSPPAVPQRTASEVRAELGVDESAPLVVVVARLHPQKDLDTFLRAMVRVAGERPDVRARIVGDGESRAALAARIGELGLDGVVALAGASRNAVDQMAAADVVALSSKWEAIPLVVLEAMSIGRPVVTTRVGIVDELIRTGESGWVVDVGDDAALGRALLDALSDPDRLAAIGAAGRTSAAHLADRDALARAVGDVYRSLVARTAA